MIFLALAVLSLIGPSRLCRTQDQPQWGQRYSRNMVSEETGLPSTFNPLTGENVAWSVSLGSHGYSTPTIARGRVLIGANNSEPRDPRHQGDRGVLLCLDEEDGSLCWQLVVPRLEDDPYRDWPRISMCSPPTIEGDCVYTLTNRYELVCLDLNGMSDGNDGPYLSEGRHMTPREQAPMKTGEFDADIIWMLDLWAEVGIYPHDSAHASILLHDQYLYLNTCNGVDNTHKVIQSPEAPSLIVIDKETGQLVARDDEAIGPSIFHSTWSSPAMGEVKGRRLVFFAGGNGVCYAFDVVQPKRSGSAVQALERVWRFDFDPGAPKENIHTYLGNRRVGPSNILSMPVFYEDHLYVTGGGDIWWGKREAWLKCIDPSGEGDITQSGLLWSYPLKHYSCSTPAIVADLVFVADCGGLLHCVDAKTGEAHWTHELQGGTWGSPLVADGKVHIGTRRGKLWILAAKKKKEVLASMDFDSEIASTPVAANGVLYVGTWEKLYALRK